MKSLVCGEIRATSKQTTSFLAAVPSTWLCGCSALPLWHNDSWRLRGEPGGLLILYLDPHSSSAKLLHASVPLRRLSRPFITALSLLMPTQQLNRPFKQTH